MTRSCLHLMQMGPDPGGLARRTAPVQASTPLRHALVDERRDRSLARAAKRSHGPSSRPRPHAAPKRDARTAGAAVGEGFSLIRDIASAGTILRTMIGEAEDILREVPAWIAA